MSASNNTPQIKFENVSKTFSSGFKSLDAVNLEIYPGEFVFLIGSSGAGKTSLLRMLIREDSPTEGEVCFNGEALSKIAPNKIHELRREIGVVFQDFKVLYSKNVFDNVAVALEVVDAPRHEVEEVVPNVLSLVGLSDKAKDMPATLSGGEMQRLSIARAMAHEPAVLIADEPTGNVDPKATKQIIEIFEKINRLGTTVIMATHDDRIVNSLKKRVVKIEKGCVVSDTQEGEYHE